MSFLTGKTKKPKPSPTEAMFDEYFELKAAADAAKAALDAHREKLVGELRRQRMFMGRTATVGSYKCVETVRKVLLKPKGFNLGEFSEAFPHLIKRTLDEGQICAWLEKADERNAAIRAFDLEVEYKEAYEIKKV